MSMIPNHLNQRQQLEYVVNEIIASRADVDRLTGELETISRSAGNDQLNPGQQQRWNDTATALEKIHARLTTLSNQRDLLVADRADRAAALTGGAVTAVTGDGAQAAGDYRDRNLVRQRSDEQIFERAGLHVDDPADGMTYRDKALAAIEGWDRSIKPEWREAAVGLVDHADRSRRDRAVADHILVTGSPDYVRAFYNYLERPTQVHLFDDRDRAALNEGSGAAGQFLVPPFLDPQVILTNVGVANPMRAIATQRTITTQTWKGITTAGVSAEWTAEAAEATDASPTFVQPTITPVRADAYVQASFEMLEDTAIAADLVMLFADARDRLEAAAWVSGTGATQPTGILTDIDLTTASRVNSATNGAFGAVDIFSVDGALGPRWRANASWLASKGIYNLVRMMATGTGPMTGAFWTDLGGAQPPILLGYPAFENSNMINSLSAATASNDSVILLGDFRQFYVVDRLGATVSFNPLVIGSNRRPTGEVGWFYHWRTGAKAVNIDAFRALRV